MSYGNDTYSPAQRRLLAVVREHGASAVAFTTSATHNTVHAGSARSLVGRGVLVEFLGPDGGAMVRRRHGLHDRTGAQP